MLKKMDAYAAQQLALIEEQFAQVAQELTQTGWISSGSVVRRFMPCGKPGCRCKANPPQLHGALLAVDACLAGQAADATQPATAGGATQLTATEATARLASQEDSGV